MNETNQAQKILAICAIITIGVGTINAYVKHKRPPSSRFLIGSGLAYFLLSAMAEVEPDIAKGLGTGVMTTVLLSGEASGLLSYIDTGEFETTKKKKPTTQNTAQRERATVVRPVDNPNAKKFSSDRLAPIPGIPRR